MCPVFLGQVAIGAEPVSLGNFGYSRTLRVIPGDATLAADESSSSMTDRADLASQNGTNKVTGGDRQTAIHIGVRGAESTG